VGPLEKSCCEHQKKKKKKKNIKKDKKKDKNGGYKRTGRLSRLYVLNTVKLFWHNQEAAGPLKRIFPPVSHGLRKNT